MTDATVRAAGGVPVRPGVSGPEVVLVHRRRYDDWTLPKGKARPGETDEECALREVEEETGLRCALGRELPSTEYLDSRGRRKRVRYWQLRVEAGEPTPRAGEIDEVRWVSVSEAASLLTYPRDVRVIDGILRDG